MAAIEIRDLDALKSLKTALKRASERGLGILPGLTNQLNRQFAELKKIEQVHQRNVAVAENNLQNAQRQLDNCRRSSYRDSAGNYNEPNCSNYEHQVSHRHRSFVNARDKLHLCKKL